MGESCKLFEMKFYLMESRFELRIFDLNIMLNYNLSKKLKLIIRRDKFNHIISSLTKLYEISVNSSISFY